MSDLYPESYYNTDNMFFMSQDEALQETVYIWRSPYLGSRKPDGLSSPTVYVFFFFT